jgi:hypothetical protein
MVPLIILLELLTKKLSFMKNISILFCVFFFIIIQVSGQNNRLYTEIQQAKQANVNFKNVSFFQVANADTVVLKEFINPAEVFFFEALSNLSDMSYCDGYNFSTGFGEQPGDLIRDRVRNATCLQCAPQYVIDFKNKTVITDTTVTGCGINVQNVNVTNNSKLILESEVETTIDGPFEVQSGSGLEIK